MSFARILVAVDGSVTSEHALDVAIDLVRRLHAELSIVHVVDPGRATDPEGGLLAAEVLENRRREGIAILSRILQHAAESVSATDFLREGNPAEEILATAQSWKADLIVVASHGRSGLARVFMGSVAEQVVRHAVVPVLVVRGAKEIKA